MTCNDLRYKEKSKLNIAIIVIMAISILCCISTVIHLAAKRKAFKEQLLGDIFAQEDDSATGIILEGKHIYVFEQNIGNTSRRLGHYGQIACEFDRVLN